MPNITLLPSDTVTVWAGTEHKAKENLPKDTVWLSDSIWGSEGFDVVELINTEGQIVSKGDVIPKH